MSTYDYDRQGASKKPDIRGARESLQQAVKVLKEVDDYLYEGTGRAGAGRALGVLVTAERLIEGLRDRLEALKKAG